MRKSAAHLVTLLVAATTTAVTLDATPARAAPGPTVSSWVTTPDRAHLLSPGASPVFDTDGTRPGQLITVNPGQTYQTMDGFGASITDSSAAVLHRLNATQRDQVMTSLFHPTQGIGLSFLRQPIGGSDFIDENHYTYDDGPADPTMQRFSIAHDEAQILPLLRRALQLNPNLKIMASPWSQPAWMKTNNSLIGGRLKDDPAVRRAWALYLLRFVQAYQAAGVPIYGLTVQNEPQNREPGSYAGTDMPVAHQAAVIDELGPMLRDAGLGHVKIMSYDHNWAEHPNDIATAQRLGYPPEPDYPYDILRTNAAQWIAGTAYHCYHGDPAAQTALHNAFPNKDVWFTECSGWRGAGDAYPKYFADTLGWHGRTLGVQVPRNWGRTVVNWNLALDSNGNPHNGGCGDTTGSCTGVVSVDGSTVTRNAEYYTLGHLSRFVKPGAVRVGTPIVGDLQNVAFRNPDGSFALLVANAGGGTQTFGVSWNGMVVSYTVPPNALATLTWPASGGGGSIDANAWYQVTDVSSGKCLDATGWGTADGTALQQWTCSPTVANNQLWQFRPTSNGYYQVVNRHSGTLGWDVSGVSATDGAQVHLWGYVGGANQQWLPAPRPGGGFTFTARHSGKCLDVRDRSAADGAPLQQWACTGGAAQGFTLAARA